MQALLGNLRVEELNDEVLVAVDPIAKIGRAEIQLLKERALRNPRQRIRICAHKSTDDPLHEMLIVHTKDTYVRPHKHIHKSESFHVVEGVVDVIVLDEIGKVVEVIEMGDYVSGRRFYYRIDAPAYHTLIIRSDVLVFHETTNGPFRREDAVFASWSPADGDLEGRRAFQAQLLEQLRLVLSLS